MLPGLYNRLFEIAGKIVEINRRIRNLLDSVCNVQSALMLRFEAMSEKRLQETNDPVGATMLKSVKCIKYKTMPYLTGYIIK